MALGASILTLFKDCFSLHYQSFILEDYTQCRIIEIQSNIITYDRQDPDNKYN